MYSKYERWRGIGLRAFDPWPKGHEFESVSTIAATVQHKYLVLMLIPEKKLSFSLYSRANAHATRNCTCVVWRAILWPIVYVLAYPVVTQRCSNAEST